MEIASLDDLVPKNHLIRKIEDAMDFSFIYDEVRGLYSNFGRESIEPVVLIKMAILQYLFGIPSMRQVIREIQVNMTMCMTNIIIATYVQIIRCSPIGQQIKKGTGNTRVMGINVKIALPGTMCRK